MVGLILGGLRTRQMVSPRRDDPAVQTFDIKVRGDHSLGQGFKKFRVGTWRVRPHIVDRVDEPQSEEVRQVRFTRAAATSR